MGVGRLSLRIDDQGQSIDALGLTGDDRLALSTTCKATVTRSDEAGLNVQEEDMLAFDAPAATWSLFFDSNPSAV